MAGGAKNVVINTQERAVSVDINRAQSFAGAALGELLRYFQNCAMGTDDLDASGVITDSTVIGTPMSGEIMGGLEVQPQVGSFSVNVLPGILMALSPDGSETGVGSPALGDSSAYKYIHDLGTTALSIAANASGQVRIDIIECQPVSVISETDNRDIFNPSSGLFAATTVTKAVQDQLNYRIRQGTGGGGWPGTVSGWMPLAVACVPSGVTSCDGCYFWDVRPLIATRLFQPNALSRDFSMVEKFYATCDVNTFSGKAVLTGWAQANGSDQVSVPSVPGRHRLGGRLRTGAPVEDLINVGGGLPDGLDLNDVHNQAGTWTAGQFVYLYLVEPFGLPNWARYTDGGFGVRKPRSPRGIPVLSTIAPVTFYGCPSAAITMPTAMGFGSSTVTKGVCIGVFVGTSGQKVLALAADGKSVFPAGGYSSNVAASAFTLNTSLTWTLIDGTTHPPNAKAIWVMLSVTVNVGPTNAEQNITGSLALADTAGTLSTVAQFPVLTIVNPTGSQIGPQVAIGPIRVPLASGYPVQTSPTRSLVLSCPNSGGSGNQTCITTTGQYLNVLGYEV